MATRQFYDEDLIAVIGGSGFYQFPGMSDVEQKRVETPFGDVIGLEVGRVSSKKVVFLARHGGGHRLPPHKINYRANIWALYQLNVGRIISLNAVGGISSNTPPNTFVIPDQIIDYTYGREHSYAELLSAELNHIDFTEPFSGPLRETLTNVLQDSGLDWVSSGTYGCTQGPRLETAAEIRRMEQDGCDIVGMTAMPEAALAKELKMQYVSLCTVANWAAGKSNDALTMAEIQNILEKSRLPIQQILTAAIASL